jgi:glycyl-tRNA synthetase alpha subunit
MERRVAMTLNNEESIYDLEHQSEKRCRKQSFDSLTHAISDERERELLLMTDDWMESTMNCCRIGSEWLR